jgi:hypothetical protein
MGCDFVHDGGGGVTCIVTSVLWCDGNIKAGKCHTTNDKISHALNTLHARVLFVTWFWVRVEWMEMHMFRENSGQKE